MRVPAEWEEQECVWLCWPSHEDHWGERLSKMRRFCSQLIKTILSYQNVSLLIQPGQELPEELFHFDHAFQLRVVVLAHNDIWIRDYGPFFCMNNGELEVRQFTFNAWGEKFPPWDLDAEVSKALSQKHQWKYSSSSLILEGGAMEFNGRGLAMTTRPCLDGKNRNPYGLHQIKTEICEHLNLDELIVFRDGLAGDHTDGHIDNLVRFVGERKVLMPNPNEASINADLLLEVFNQCRSWRHPTEEWALDVDFLPSLDPLVYGKEQLPRSYMNFIFLNGALLLPFYGESMDTLAQEKLSIQFPDRDVIGIDCRLLIQEGGALHCMTRQQPK